MSTCSCPSFWLLPPTLLGHLDNEGSNEPGSLSTPKERLESFARLLPSWRVQVPIKVHFYQALRCHRMFRRWIWQYKIQVRLFNQALKGHPSIRSSPLCFKRVVVAKMLDAQEGCSRCCGACVLLWPTERRVWVVRRSAGGLAVAGMVRRTSRQLSALVFTFGYSQQQDPSHLNRRCVYILLPAHRQRIDRVAYLLSRSSPKGLQTISLTAFHIFWTFIEPWVIFAAAACCCASLPRTTTSYHDDTWRTLWTGCHFLCDIRRPGVPRTAVAISHVRGWHLVQLGSSHVHERRRNA